MIATIEERINDVIRNTETIAPPPVEMGSDTYLDQVLYYREKLEGVTLSLAVLNEDIIADSNINPQHILSLLPRLKSLHVTFLTTNDHFLHGAKKSFGTGLRTTLEQMRVEVRNLREVIDDVNRIHVTMKNDDDIQSLFSQL